MRLLLLCLILSSCAKLSHYKTYQENEDFYKYKVRDIDTNLAVRDETGKLVTSKSKAQKVLNNFKTLEDLEASLIVECKTSFNFKKLYHHAESQLQSNESTSARETLDFIKSQCSNMNKFSHIDYLYAYSYELDKNIEKRDIYLNSFIQYSQSIYPKNFYQLNELDQAQVLYKKYKDHAKAALTGSQFVLSQNNSKHLHIARYDSLDDSYLVGSKVTKQHFMLLPYYSSITRGGLQGAYVFPSKYGAFIPAISMNGPFGTLGGLNFRTQLTETIDRKHQTGINIGLYQWKEYTYRKDYLGYVSDVEIEDEGVGSRVGYGGTYQFSSKYNFMYQGVGYSAKDFGTSLTSMVGYKLDEISMFQFGLLHNQTVLAWKVMQIYIMYNFSGKSIDANISTGFSF